MQGWVVPVVAEWVVVVGTDGAADVDGVGAGGGCVGGAAGAAGVAGVSRAGRAIGG